MWSQLLGLDQEQPAAAKPEEVRKADDQDGSRPLPAASYDGVKDHTPIRASDHDAFFETLEWLRQASEPEISAASIGRVTYAQLYQQPAHYRGTIVTVEGVIRQVSTRAAPENDGGITRWHELFLQPRNNQSAPILIYTLTLPEELSEVGRMRQPARVTGIFFKRMIYQAQDDAAAAPLLLAQGVEITGPPLNVTEDDFTMEWIIVSSCLALAAAAIFIFFYRRMATGRSSAERSAQTILAQLESKRANES